MSINSFSKSNLRSFSPPYLFSNSLLKKHKELIHQRVSQLPYSPKSKARLEQAFEEILNSIHFSNKPDIIPFPYPQFPNSASIIELESNLKEALDLAKEEKLLRKKIECENESLKSRLYALLEIETKYEEYRLKALKMNELNNEIEKLNIRIKILLDENEELRRKVRNSGFALGNRGFKELEIEKELSSKLKQQLLDVQGAYEELRQSYFQDSEIRKREQSSTEKTQIELPINERKLKQGLDDSIQEKIRNMKDQYLDKLKRLEERIETERMEIIPSKKIKNIEEKIGSLQGKIVEKVRNGNFSEKSIKVSTPSTEKFILKKEAKTRLKTSPRRIKGDKPVGEKNKKEEIFSLRKKYSQKVLTHSPDRVLIRSKSRSPDLSLSTSRSPTTNRTCKTCIKRHGHEWAS